MVQRLVFLGPGQEGVEHRAGGQRGRQRQVPPGQALGQAQQVGLDPLVLAGEHLPRPPEAGGHLVDHQQDAVTPGDVGDPPQVAVGGGDDPGRPLHQRLDDDRRHPVALPAQHVFQPVGAGQPARRVRQPQRAPVAVRRGDRRRGEQQRPVRLVEPVDAADRDGPDRVAVVGVLQPHERRPVLAPVAPVGVGHLQRHLHRGGAVLGEEHPLEPARRQRHEAGGQLDGRRVGQAQERGVGQAAELLHDGGVDGPDAVAVHVDPQRGDTVEVAAPFGVDQLAALGPLDDQGVVLHPPLHGGERVPDVGLVEGRQPPGPLGPRHSGGHPRAPGLSRHGASRGMSFRTGLAGSALVPSAATTKRPSPGPPPATGMPSDSSSATSSSGARPKVVR